MAGAYRSSAYGVPPSARSRVAAWLLAAGLVALLLLALIRLGGLRREMFGDGRPLATFDVAAVGEEARAPTPRRQERERRAASKEPPRPDSPRPPVQAPVPPVPDPPLHLPGVMLLSRADYAAADLSRIKGTAPPASAGVALAGAGEADATPVGLGPGGQQLYPAQWYREPRRAELAPYLKGGGGPGWGMVACRTIDRYHVEDCQELGETPGSGIARALRQAAFQFLVRPPRVGGKPQVGTWVRIRFDVTVAKEPER